MGLMAGLGLAAAIVSIPVMAEKGPLRATLGKLGGGQDEVPGGDTDGRGRAVVKVFEEQLCGRIETGAIESSSSKATINLGMSGEVGPIVANLQAKWRPPRRAPPGLRWAQPRAQPWGLRRQPPAQLLPPRATGAQSATTTTGDTTLAQATTTPQTTTVPQATTTPSPPLPDG